jgi:hypothetical protein
MSTSTNVETTLVCSLSDGTQLPDRTNGALLPAGDVRVEFTRTDGQMVQMTSSNSETAAHMIHDDLSDNASLPHLMELALTTTVKLLSADNDDAAPYLAPNNDEMSF